MKQRILLDTCAVIWLGQDPTQFSAAAKAALQDPNNYFYFSHLAVWKMEIKQSIGKLMLGVSVETFIKTLVAQFDCADLPLCLEDYHYLPNLPLYHCDPFDRLLIAQAARRNWPIITSDSVYANYPVQVIW